MSKQTVTLVDPFDVSLIGPNYANATFGFKVLGHTTKGNDITVLLNFPIYYIEFIAERLHEAVAAQERWLNDNKRALKGNL